MSAVANVNISQNEDDEKINSGWLMKRTRVVHKWQQQWFILNDKTLLYGDDAQVRHQIMKKTILILRPN